MLNKITDYVLVFILLAMICGIFLMGKSVGYRFGYNAGASETKHKLTKDFVRDLENCNAQIGYSYTQAWDQATAYAKKDCREEVDLNGRICKTDIEKAFRIGQLNGMKRIGKLCGITIK